MGAKRGRLEARITVPAGGWAITFTDTSGATAVTITAGTYYLVELIAFIDAALDADWTISVSDGESSSTGRCTINSGLTPFSVTFTSTDARAVIGFTGNIAGVSSAQTGTNHCVGLWLPDIEKFSMYGDSANGSYVSDFRATKGPTGVLRAYYGNGHRVHRGINWGGVTGARAMAHHETVSGESFETFYLDVVTGRKSYIPVAPYVRLYWDADVDATYAVGRLLWPSDFDLSKLVDTWTGRYIVDLPPLVVES